MAPQGVQVYRPSGRPASSSAESLNAGTRVTEKKPEVQVYRPSGPLVPESKTTDRKPTQAYVPSGLKANVDKKPLEFYVPSAPFRSSTVTKPTGRQPVLVYDPRGTVKITNKNGKPVAFYVPSGAPPHT
ncbi:hypothetical protein C8R42DRAFT_687620 [Lentinula raphanica]|nr:hypothetical protein C8R42DRAFT_687620 [Lentinula raphanica]